MTKLMQQSRNIAAFIIGRRRAGRHLTVFNDDVFVVSYPKSGNTWTRFIIANLLNQMDQDAVDFSNIEQIIPDIYVHSDRKLRSLMRPRILKSHEYFDPRYQRVICIVRDPRDVAVSYYHHLCKVRAINDDHPMEAFIDAFLTGRWGESYGSWGENVGSWLGARQVDRDFLLLRYEAMIKDPVSAAKDIALFLDQRIDDAKISRAVSASSFSAMQALETSSHDRWAALKGSRRDIRFVRSGVAGGWKDTLEPDLAYKIAAKWPSAMRVCGYK